MLLELVLLSLVTTAVAEPNAVEGNVEAIIHQYWPDDQVPAKYQQWRESWTNLNPGTKYVLWTDQANRVLVFRFYKWLLPAYDGLSSRLMQATFARYLYLHAFGGMYADVDMQAMRPVSDLLADHPGTAFLGAMEEDPNSPQHTPVAWLASRKGHPFWMFAIGEVLRRMDNKAIKLLPEHVTGSAMLQKALEQYRALKSKPEDSVTVLSPSAIFPVNWKAVTSPCTAKDLYAEKYSLANDCAAKHIGSYAIAYWVEKWT